MLFLVNMAFDSTEQTRWIAFNGGRRIEIKGKRLDLELERYEYPRLLKGNFYLLWYREDIDTFVQVSL